MPRACYPQGASIDPRETVEMRGRAVKRHAAELAFRQPSHQGLPADLDIVDQTAREQAVPHVQSLRDAVEREGDESLGGRLCAHGVPECPLQKLLADAASLLIG